MAVGVPGILYLKLPILLFLLSFNTFPSFTIFLSFLHKGKLSFLYLSFFYTFSFNSFLSSFF